MDKETKRALALGILISGVIIFAVVYFFWGALINRGTILINAKAPFTVSIRDLPQITCTESPCKIVQKIGEKTLILEKEGYNGKIVDTDVNLWRTVSVDVNFELIPFLQKTASYPLMPEKYNYEIIFDEKSGNPKLVLADDPYKTAIIYFTGEVSPLRIFGSKNAALIVSSEGEVYLVNTVLKERTKVEINLQDITQGKISDNGKYFAYNESRKLKIVDFAKLAENFSTAISETGSDINPENGFWTYENKFVFATDQSTQSEGERVTLLPEKIGKGFSFIVFDPQENSMKKLGTYQDIISVPYDVLVLANESELYFRSGEENFKVVLKEF